MTAKPNFLIIGAPKCGTTSLWAILRQHPDVFMPECKEPDFFSRDEAFERGWEWYRSLFAEVQSESAIGEASPSYCMVESFPHTPERIASFLPDAKIIYIVRHPLERMESAWTQFLCSGHPVSRSFTKSVREYPLFLEQSRYWQTITAYREHFPDNRLLVVDFEDLRSDAVSVAARCFRFLGVDPDFRVADAGVPRNTRASKRVERSSIRWLRQSPAWELLRAAIPSRFRRWSYQLFGTAPLPQRPEWDREARSWVVDQLRQDTASFLAYAEKPADYWNLTADNAETKNRNSKGSTMFVNRLKASRAAAPLKAVRRWTKALCHWLLLRQLAGRRRLRYPTSPLRLHIGCGTRRLPGFVNIDQNYGPAVDYVGDAGSLPCRDDSVDRIEAYHLIEHIAYPDVDTLLEEWFRVLAPGGKLVLECPDFDEAVRAYLRGDDEMLFSIFGRRRFPGDAHRWGYNAERLKETLSAIGFSEITEEIPQDYHAAHEPCLRMECAKPQATARTDVAQRGNLGKDDRVPASQTV